MARGESQTLLIWTIIFLVFSLIMIIVTVVMRSKYTEATSQLAEAKSQISQLNGDVSNLKSEGGKLRELVGYADTAMPMADIETAFADHLKNFAPTVSSEGASYMTALKTLGDSYKNQIDENLALQRRNMEQTILLAEQAKKEKELQTMLQAKVDQAQNDLELARQNHAKNLADVMTSNKTLEENLNKVSEDARTGIAEANRLRDEQRLLREKTTLINTTLAGIVADMESPIPTYTNAEIIWVSSDSTKVQINIGSNHGLRARMPFSVYGSDEHEISVDTSKGKIEVTQILDGNTAEARVTEDILINPIIPGDKIYTPVWKPGQNVRFALSSGLDLDGDEVSDPHKAITLIQMCGGEVDAYIDDLTGEMINENGKMVREAFLVGQITEETRYLIIGEKPDPDSSVTLFNARRQLEEEAKMYGLTTLSLKDLMNLMGQRPQSQTVGFGKRNRATNNYEMEPDVVNQRMPGRVFNKYENPDAEPATTDKPPVSPLFNQNRITNRTGTVSPLFQPRSAKVKETE